MIIGTPVAGGANVPMGFVKSLLATTNMHIFQEGPSIFDNRNKLFERARFEGQSLLFIDSDMVFIPKDVAIMEEHLKDKDIVTGVCVMSFPGFPPSLFKKDKNGRYKPSEPEEGEIDGCGAAFLGISLKVLKDLTEPFTPIFEPKTGQFFGEDISFCKRAQEAGYKIWCDPNLQIGHIKTIVKYYGK